MKIIYERKKLLIKSLERSLSLTIRSQCNYKTDGKCPSKEQWSGKWDSRGNGRNAEFSDCPQSKAKQIKVKL